MHSTSFSPARRQRGLSLPETMLAAAVFAALVSTGAPALGNALSTMRMGATASDLIASVQLARTEAIARGARVAIATHRPRDWTSGWRVFVDGNNNGRVDAGEPVLREVGAAADTSLRIEARFGATYAGDVISYDSLGVARRPGGTGLVLGRITLSSNDSVRTLCFSSLAMRTVRAGNCEA